MISQHIIRTSLVVLMSMLTPGAYGIERLAEAEDPIIETLKKIQAYSSKPIFCNLSKEFGSGSATATKSTFSLLLKAFSQRGAI